MSPGGGLEQGGGRQLKAGLKLLFSVGGEAARPLAGRSRFMINLLSQGHPSFKTVSMFKGPHGGRAPELGPSQSAYFIGPLAVFRLGQLCKYVYPGTLLIQAWPK